MFRLSLTKSPNEWLRRDSFSRRERPPHHEPPAPPSPAMTGQPCNSLAPSKIPNPRPPPKPPDHTRYERQSLLLPAHCFHGADQLNDRSLSLVRHTSSAKIAVNNYAHRPHSTINSQSEKCNLSTHSLQNMLTTSDSQRSWSTSHDGQVTSDQRVQGENTRIFYSSVKLWPTGIRTPREGGSPLVQTMLHWTSDTRLQTYAWNDVEIPTFEPAGLKDHVTASRPHLSQANWNRREANWLMPSVWAATLSSYVHRLQASPKTTKRLSPDTLRDNQKTSKRQWERMQAFYSSMSLWPSKEQHNSSELEGGSPLLWTMLHPPMAETRVKTYAWDGHLDNFMPWKACQTDGATVRPPLISYARWNIRRGTEISMSPVCADNLPGFSHGYHETPETPNKHLSPVDQEYERPQTTNAPNSLNSTTSIQASILLSSLVAVVVFLLAPLPGDLKFAATLSQTASTRANKWRNQRPLPVVKPAKTRKSCYRWLVAIIQRLWNTAWDLLAHRNVDSIYHQGPACPYVR